jgi:hypothetical protein
VRKHAEYNFKMAFFPGNKQSLSLSSSRDGIRKTRPAKPVPDLEYSTKMLVVK